MKDHYDICFVCFEELRADARTLNISRTFAKHGKRVAIIAPATSDEVQQYAKDKIKVLPMKIRKQKRYWKKWFGFNFEINKYKKINAKAVWANDFHSLFAAIRIAKRKNSQLLYDSREIYSALGPLAENKFKQAIITQLEQRLVQRVDNIIVSGPMDAEYLKDHFNTDHPYSIIMNLPPYSEYKESNKIREELGISKETKIILYQGLLIKGRGIIPVIRALQYIEDSVFVLIGWGPHVDDFNQIAKSLHVGDRVFFLGKKSYDELFEYTASADLGIAYIEPITLSYRLALPNKLFEYCMARIPSLVSDLPAMREVINQHRIGELIEVGAEPSKFAFVMGKMLIENEKYKQECEIASKIYSYDTQETEILQLLSDEE